MDTKEADSKRKEPAKKGLHGWKAALAVFGCGTLAAFSVFGVIVGVLSLFISTASSGIPGADQQERPVEMIGEPQASIEPGDLDLCSRNLVSASQVQLERTDSGDSYSDSVNEDERRIKDSCEWLMVSDYSGAERWNLTYSYEAVIKTPGGDRVNVASQEFDAASGELGSDFVRIEDQGEAGFAERSNFVYGEIEPGVSGYVLLAQTRSAVYEIQMKANSDSLEEGALVPMPSMRREAEKLVRISDVEFNLWIPGKDN
ncbi:hypothetical protein NE857_06705 [Nocardiopsis exhalans]|uniref:Uncharacterized protein n=1 Tax=Nocardiopsis exhalans TaxID=163604 RepID=A0ABY5DE39_9ACTN|nr:hypothetical protein [Nocardiopsis exhalans]USY21305.1 hypothetical protein NE857_06705 [Nocardiopsis exhalans]